MGVGRELNKLIRISPGKKIIKVGKGREGLGDL